MHPLANRVSIYAVTGLILCAGGLYAQRGAGGGAGGSNGPGMGRTPTTTSPNITTQPLPSNTTRTPQQQGIGAPIFLSGRVITDDGSTLDTNVRIERVCGAAIHFEGHVDSRGHFAFQIGSPTALDLDASTSDTNMGPRSQEAMVSGSSPTSMAGRGIGQNALAGCALRASMPGYHSDEIELSGRRSMDNPDVGVIVLHHIGHIDGTTTSFTTMAAPKQAKKLYEKALQLQQKGKLDDAENHLNQATSMYPQYAVAWEALGELAAKQSELDSARSDFEAAIKADSKFVNPYEQLAFLYARQQKWQNAADTSDRGIGLDPVEFPGLFWCNAVANYNLKRRPEAEKSIRSLLKLDTQHRYPQAEKMMGELLIDHGNVQDAAVHMRSYLAMNPNGEDAEEVRRWLGKVDQASANTVPASTPAPSTR